MGELGCLPVFVPASVGVGICVGGGVGAGQCRWWHRRAETVLGGRMLIPTTG